MTVRSTPLLAPTVLTTTAGSVIPGTAGRTFIVKTLCMHNTAGAARRITLFWNGDTDADIIATWPLPAGESVVVNGFFLVIDLNYNLWAKANGAGTIMSAFGANLLGDPS